MTPKHEGHPKDCNDESNQCHPAEALLVVRRHAESVTERGGLRRARRRPTTPTR